MMFGLGVKNVGLGWSVGHGVMKGLCGMMIGLGVMSVMNAVNELGEEVVEVSSQVDR